MVDHFNVHQGFCPLCGSIFPLLGQSGNIVCYSCKKEYAPQILKEEEIEYTIQFNSYDYGKASNKISDGNPEPQGPVVERICSKCGHDKMSYATLQLRSADEGQTVFFTCIKCNNKETENS